MKKIIYILMFLLFIGIVSASLEKYTVKDSLFYLDSVKSSISGFKVISGEGDFNYDSSDFSLNFYDSDMVLEISNVNDFIIINGYRINDFQKIQLSYDNEDYLIIKSYIPDDGINFGLKDYIVEISKKSNVHAVDYTFEVRLNNKKDKSQTNVFSLISNKDNLNFVSSVSLDSIHVFSNNYVLNEGDTLTLNPDKLLSSSSFNAVNGKIQLGSVNEVPILVCGKKLYIGDGLDSNTNFGFQMSLDSDSKSQCLMTSCDYFGDVNSNTELIMACDDINTDTVQFKADVAKDIQDFKFDGTKWECGKVGCLGSANVDLYPMGDKEFLRLINNKFESYEVNGYGDVLNADQFYLGGTEIYLVDPSDDKASFEKVFLKVVISGGTMRLLVDGQNKKMKFKDGGKYKIDITTTTNTVVNYVDCCEEEISFGANKDSDGYPKAYACSSSSNKDKLFGLLPDSKEYSVGNQDSCVSSTASVVEEVEEDNLVTCGACQFDKNKMYYGYSLNDSTHTNYYFSENSLDKPSYVNLFGSLSGDKIKGNYCENIVCTESEFLSFVSVGDKSVNLESNEVCGNTEATKDWSCSCPMASDSYSIGGRLDYLNNLWTSQDCKSNNGCKTGLCNEGNDVHYYCCSDTARDKGGSVDISEKEINPFAKPGSVSNYVSEGNFCETLNSMACLSLDPYLLNNDEVAFCNSQLEWEKYNECLDDTICDPMSCLDSFDLDTCCKPVSTISERDTTYDIFTEGASCEYFSEGDLICNNGNRKVLSCQYDDSDPAYLIWVFDKSCSSNEICDNSYCSTAESSEECCFDLNDVVEDEEEIVADLSLEACTDNVECIVKYGLKAFCLLGTLGSPNYCYAGQCQYDYQCSGIGMGTCNEQRGICESYPLCLSDETCIEYLGPGYVCDGRYCKSEEVTTKASDLGESDSILLVEEIENTCTNLNDLACNSDGNILVCESGYNWELSSDVCYNNLCDSSICYDGANVEDPSKCCTFGLDDESSDVPSGKCSDRDCEAGYICDLNTDTCFEGCEDDSQCSSDAACDIVNSQCVVCEDTDGGDDAQNKGIVDGVSVSGFLIEGYEDYCGRGSSVNEIYCDYKQGHTYQESSVINCEDNEECSDGACIALQDDLVECSSNEDCENGYVCGDEGICNDYCDDDSQCSSDAACNMDNNQCVVCEDTDGGKNYFIYGDIEGIQTQSKGYIFSYDKCDRNEKLKEYYCEFFDGHTYAYYNIVSCSSGYTCSEGVCVSSRRSAPSQEQKSFLDWIFKAKLTKKLF